MPRVICYSPAPADTSSYEIMLVGADFSIATYSCVNSTYYDLEMVTAQTFSLLELEPSSIASAVGLGFFILLPVWAAALGVKYLLRSIRLT